MTEDKVHAVVVSEREDRPYADLWHAGNVLEAQANADPKGMESIFMKKTLMVLMLLCVCVGCDQSTKYTAKHILEGRPTRSYLGDSFRLSYTENSGAFLSLGAGMPEHIRQTIFIILVAMFLVGFLIFLITNKRLDAWAVSSGTLILGGGLGNLIDRIMNQGAVVDFMNIGLGSLRTGIFNVADVAIMAGVVIFAVSTARKPRDPAKTADS